MKKIKLAIFALVVLLTMPTIQIGFDAVDDGLFTAPFGEKIGIIQDNANYTKASVKLVVAPIKGVNNFLEENFMDYRAKEASSYMWSLIGSASNLGGHSLDTVLDNLVNKF